MERSHLSEMFMKTTWGRRHCFNITLNDIDHDVGDDEVMIR